MMHETSGPGVRDGAPAALATVIGASVLRRARDRDPPPARLWLLPGGRETVRATLFPPEVAHAAAPDLPRRLHRGTRERRAPGDRRRHLDHGLRRVHPAGAGEPGRAARQLRGLRA